MSALHPKTAFWLNQKTFDGLNCFAELEERINLIPEEKDRGDVFEIFIEAYLATQAITQRTDHWVVGQIPLAMRERFNLPSDSTGIDGIYEAKGGTMVAYQVKYRKGRNLTFAEVAPFLGLTEKFSDRVIFTNAETLSDKAHQRSRWVSRENFLALPPEAFTQMEAWLKQKPLPVLRAQPDPNYQTQVLADIQTSLASHDAATVVMACGTGKTLVALWAAEQVQPSTVLVLVPSLALLQQTLKEWSEQTTWGTRFSYLCVCSDPTVALKDDALTTDKTEVGFRVDTDPAEVRRFLERKTGDVKIIFSTYQSSPVVAEGAKELPPFDLGIFDEAHKTTGRVGGRFNFALSNKNICIRKRLFFTATPRHIDIRHRDKDGEFPVQSMDDESVYGPRAHTLSFAEAARKGIICSYKVILSIIDKQMVSDFALNHGITLVKDDEISARWVAHLVALKQAIEKVNASKIITFHSRVKTAQDFASSLPQGIGYHLPDYDVRHVNGAQRSLERVELIRAFTTQPKSILTNARCLTEGVNIPAVDMVAFIDPRQSRVDIAQAVGRAMRRPRGPTTKTLGYVVVPLFAGNGTNDSIEQAVHSEKFDAVADVLNALQEHDEDLIDIIREMREQQGMGAEFDPKRLHEKVEVIGPSVELARLTRSIDIEIVDRIGVGWDEWYGLLKRYNEREGHCRVHYQHIEGGWRLGLWVHNQRAGEVSMTDERRQRLDTLGFVWNVFSDNWEQGFAALKIFHEREGHCRVPNKSVEGDFNLGAWASAQRMNKDSMAEQRKQRLDTLKFVWDPLAEDWEQGFTALKVFYDREGHCRVTDIHIEGDYRLGQWVRSLRERQDSVNSERRQRLNALGFVWAAFADDWERGFAALKVFYVREGHCRVPQKHTEGGYRLGIFVSIQRLKKDSMPEGRRQRLDALGLVWNAYVEDWEQGFAALNVFHDREGHCRVPNKQTEGDYQLGGWVGKQRASKDSMTEERRQRLDTLGFVWDPLADDWERGFAALKVFHEREGHFRVPTRHTDGDYHFGLWVSVQRRMMNSMPLERRQRLDALGFVWDALADASAQVWDQAFAALKVFHDREGHCRVPNKHIEGGNRLGIWVSVQRRMMNSMTEQRRQRLDALGFVWDPLADASAHAWERGFAALKVFHDREGHCSVPIKHTERDYSLGSWVKTQRKNRDSLTGDRRQRLDALGFVWDALADASTQVWEQGFAALKVFHDREGHCRVSSKHNEGGCSLGSWVSIQRMNKDLMAEERRQRLDALGFVWDPLADASAQVWERGFAALKVFHDREGHCRVPARHTEGGYSLGSWGQQQRALKDSMTGERRQRLDALGFVWDPFADAWERGFAALKAFKYREGHCRVPAKHSEQGYNIGTWVRHQRALKDSMAEERRQRLDALEFVWDVEPNK